MLTQSCPNCGNPVRGGAKFCGHCRHPLSAPIQMTPPFLAEIRCPRCGTSNRSNARFCSHCGQVLAPLTPAGNQPRQMRMLLIATALAGGAVLACLVSALIWVMARGETTTAMVSPTAVATAVGVAAPTPSTMPSAALSQTPVPPTIMPTPTKPLAFPSPTPSALSVGTKAGQRAPEFTLRDSAGRLVSLSEMHGKPVIVSFWASWCGYCRSMLPDLNAFYQESRSRDLVVLAVNTSDTDRSTAETFVREKGLEFAILWDEGNQVSKKYDVRGLPTNFFIDRSGVIRAVIPGAMSKSDMSKKANSIY